MSWENTAAIAETPPSAVIHLTPDTDRGSTFCCEHFSRYCALLWHGCIFTKFLNSLCGVCVCPPSEDTHTRTHTLTEAHPHTHTHTLYTRAQEKHSPGEPLLHVQANTLTRAQIRIHVCPRTHTHTHTHTPSPLSNTKQPPSKWRHQPAETKQQQRVFLRGISVVTQAGGCFSEDQAWSSQERELYIYIYIYSDAHSHGGASFAFVVTEAGCLCSGS